jgi:hypothetical protein
MIIAIQNTETQELYHNPHPVLYRDLASAVAKLATMPAPHTLVELVPHAIPITTELARTLLEM